MAAQVNWCDRAIGQKVCKVKGRSLVLGELRLRGLRMGSGMLLFLLLLEGVVLNKRMSAIDSSVYDGNSDSSLAGAGRRRQYTFFESQESFDCMCGVP